MTTAIPTQTLSGSARPGLGRARWSRRSGMPTNNLRRRLGDVAAFQSAPSPRDQAMSMGAAMTSVHAIDF